MADELNFQLPPEGFDSYLFGIIPDDQAVLAGAFATAMQQIRNINQVSIEDFAQVVYSTENAVNLPLTNGTDVPTDLQLAEVAQNKTALGSGIYGTYTMSNFFGCMSGLPYPLKDIYQGIKDLETRTLYSIYQEIFDIVNWGTAQATATFTYDGSNYTVTGFEIFDNGGGYTVAPSVTVNGGSGATATAVIGTDPNDLLTYGKVIDITLTSIGIPNGTVPTVTITAPSADGRGNWPARNSLIDTEVTNANNEIFSILTSSNNNFNKANILNTNWNITGTALKHEQRARYAAISPTPIPYDEWLSAFPTSLYVFVDSLPSLAQNTYPHMSAQTLENISDFLTPGGQSIIGMMRQERNQARLSSVGINLDNNLPDKLPLQQELELLTNGSLCGAIEGVEGPDGCIYTLPAYSDNQFVPIPKSLYDGNIVLTDQVKPGSVETLPLAGTLIPVGPGITLDKTGVPIRQSQELGLVNLKLPQNIIPPNLNALNNTGTLLPSTYDVADAIDKVIECNCDCWV